MPFAEYLRQAVFAPLGMNAELRGSAGADVYGTLDDLVALARELQSPTLVAPETLDEMTSVQFAGLNGVLPDVGRFDPNDWGLGVELRDAKQPHWTGTRNSERTFGHFGGSGTFLWVDPAAGLALRVPHRPRVRQLGARGVAQAVRRGAGGSMKVAVVGAGVMGLATARVLAQRGHDVTVYEQFELKHARGSSHGTSRIFRLSYDDEHWIRLAQRAYELWRELERESGRTLLELDGLVDVQRVPKRRVEALSGAGVPVEELTPAEALERFGFAYDDVESLVFTRDAGIALADATIDALADGARAAGRRDPRAHARRVARRRAGRPRRRHGRRLGAEAARPRRGSTPCRRARRPSTSAASASRR